MEYQTVYFEHPGSANTDETLALVKEWSDRLNMRTVIVATTSGATGAKAAEAFPGREVIAVTHSAGFSAPDTQELLPEHRDRMLRAGAKVLTCQHAFAGVSRAVRFKFATYEIDEIVANALRILGQGVKVAIEIALMAADAGLVRTDLDVIAVGGTESGADSALVLRPANVSRFFDLRIRWILCKPWET